MPGGLDHIVHAVRDLDAAAAFYRHAGFTVGARNRHPWGTHNQIVQLGGCYIEILTVAEPEKIVPHGARSFSFGAFNRDYLVSRQGLSMLLLNSRDATADNNAFATAAIGDFEVFDFAREGSKPDGTPVKLAFSLVFARDPASPDAGFGACQHHFPENFWNPAFQTHANGARDVSGVVLVAGRPADHAGFFEAYTGIGAEWSGCNAMRFRTPNGDIEVIDATAFRDRYGVMPEGTGEGATFAGLRFTVRDIEAAAQELRQNNPALQRTGAGLVVAPQAGFGATLIFEAPKEG